MTKRKEACGGKNHLTNAKIYILQNYFGIAMRQNIGNLQDMMDAITSSLSHVLEYHEKCPRNSDTWCQYQKDQIDSTHLYKSKNGLPLDVRKDACLQWSYEAGVAHEVFGKTQNANESFHCMIWNRVYWGEGGSCILSRDDDNPCIVN